MCDYISKCFSYFDNSSSIEFWLMLWMIVETLIFLLYIIRRITIISYWGCIKNPAISTAKINYFTFFILNTFETIWFIFGNVLYFRWVINPKVNKKNQEVNLSELMLFMIIYGYFNMLYYCGTMAFMGFVVYTMNQ